MKFYICILCFIYSFCNAETINLVRNEKLAEQLVAEIILKEVYNQSGYSITVTPLPPARASIKVTRGEYGGEVARIYSYGIKFPELIRVEPSYYYLTTVAYYKKNSDVVVNTVEDLKKYRVGIISGVQHSLDATKDVTRVSIVPGAKNLFLMLRAGHLDVVLDTGINGKKAQKFYNFGDTLHETVLDKLELFHYLHKNQESLVPVLSKTIVALIKSRELQKIKQIAEDSFFQNSTMSYLE